MYNSGEVRRYGIAAKQLEKPYEIRYSGEGQTAKEITAVPEDFYANITLSTSSVAPGYNLDSEENWKKLFSNITDNVYKKNQTDFL